MAKNVFKNIFKYRLLSRDHMGIVLPEICVVKNDIIIIIRVITLCIIRVRYTLQRVRGAAASKERLGARRQTRRWRRLRRRIKGTGEP